MTGVGSGNGVTSIDAIPDAFTVASGGACCAVAWGAVAGIVVGTKIGVDSPTGRTVGVFAAGALAGATVICVADFTVARAFSRVKATVGGRLLAV